MNTKALEELERVVREAPDDLFCMNVIAEQLQGGTVRCAFGWTLIDPWFQANTKVEDRFNRIKAGQRLHYELAAEFDISNDDANNLFGGDLSASAYKDASGKLRCDVTKLEVITNIRRLARGAPTKPYKATQL